MEVGLPTYAADVVLVCELKEPTTANPHPVSTANYLALLSEYSSQAESKCTRPRLRITASSIRSTAPLGTPAPRT